jgi:hypothetical protein
MYFPPYKQLLEAATGAAGQLPENQKLTVSKVLLDFLIQAALSSFEFDEAAYLAANPDLKTALGKSGELTPHQHFVGYGYFEGRDGTMPRVDEKWYLSTYKDVGEAVAKKMLKSGAEHFRISGAAEGRSPSAAYVDIANHWKTLLRQ